MMQRRQAVAGQQGGTGGRTVAATGSSSSSKESATEGVVHFGGGDVSNNECCCLISYHTKEQHVKEHACKEQATKKDACTDTKFFSSSNPGRHTTHDTHTCAHTCNWLLPASIFRNGRQPCSVLGCTKGGPYCMIRSMKTARSCALKEHTLSARPAGAGSSGSSSDKGSQLSCVWTGHKQKQPLQQPLCALCKDQSTQAGSNTTLWVVGSSARCVVTWGFGC